MGVVCFGELLIDFVATETGVSVGDAPAFEKAPGGAPANVAVGVSRLGHPAAFLGQVGDDPFGHYLVNVLKADAVDTRGLCFSKAARTALAFVSLEADGERSFVFYRHPSADMLMRSEDVLVDVIDDAKIFHFGSITMISEPSRSATLRAVEYARDRGLIISYDPNLRLALWPDEDTARTGMHIGLDYAHILKISDEELAFLTGGNDVMPLWRDGLRVIIVTHGADGATAYTRRDRVRAATYSVNAVDTTGAGDGFVAGMLVGILENPDQFENALLQIMRRANAVGALTTTRRGAIPALPTREQVDAFLNASA